MAGSILRIEQTAMQLAALVGTATAPLLYGWLAAGFFALAGAVALAGFAAGAPTLRREWQSIRAAGLHQSSTAAANPAARATAEQSGEGDLGR